MYCTFWLLIWNVKLGKPAFRPPAFRPLWRFILPPLLISSHKFWFLYEDCVLPPEIFHCVLFANIISLTYSFSFRKGCFRGPSSHYWSYFYNETKSGFRVLSIVSSLELSNCCEDKKKFWLSKIFFYLNQVSLESGSWLLLMLSRRQEKIVKCSQFDSSSISTK